MSEDDFDEDDLELDYDVTKLSDKEIEDKLSKVNSDLEYHEEMASSLSGEQDYLYDEKNKRYRERKTKEKEDSSL